MQHFNFLTSFSVKRGLFWMVAINLESEHCRENSFGTFNFVRSYQNTLYFSQDNSELRLQECLGTFLHLSAVVLQGEMHSQGAPINQPIKQSAQAYVAIPFANKAMHAHANTITLLGFARRKWNVK